MTSILFEFRSKGEWSKTWIPTHWWKSPSVRQNYDLRFDFNLFMIIFIKDLPNERAQSFWLNKINFHFHNFHFQQQCSKVIYIDANTLQYCIKISVGILVTVVRSEFPPPIFSSPSFSHRFLCSAASTATSDEHRTEVFVRCNICKCKFVCSSSDEYQQYKCSEMNIADWMMNLFYYKI